MLRSLTIVSISFTIVRALGPTIDVDSCAGNGLAPNMYPQVRAALDEAFELAVNAARLADTPEDFWDYRVWTVFDALVADSHTSHRGQMAKSRSSMPSLL